MKRRAADDTLAVRLVKGFARDGVNVSSAGGYELLSRLKTGPLAFSEIDSLPAEQLPEAYFTLQTLWMRRAIEVLDRADDPMLAMAATVSGQSLDVSETGDEGKWKLSRFAYVRAVDGGLQVESPCALAVVRLLNPRAMSLLGCFDQPIESGAAQERFKSGSKVHWRHLMQLLRRARVILECDERGDCSEDRQPDLMQWSFHDLLFHHRSRQGRHELPLGADFRFRGKLAHEPIVKPNPWLKRAIRLDIPSPASVALRDPTFTQALESRRSIRAHNAGNPITVRQLGEFLYRSARIRYRFQTELGEFSSRPYPSGGASYELELYLTVNQCQGLERGFYYYDAQEHAICLIERENADTEGMLNEAWISAAKLCRPQVLITIASRFHRVNWKYSGMAYAAQLKNTGVLYQTFYLVATAMNLAGCGLGLGNSERFSRLARTNYYEEGSIGEFMLGNPA